MEVLCYVCEHEIKVDPHDEKNNGKKFINIDCPKCHVNLVISPDENKGFDVIEVWVEVKCLICKHVTPFNPLELDMTICEDMTDINCSKCKAKITFTPSKDGSVSIDDVSLPVKCPICDNINQWNPLTDNDEVSKEPINMDCRRCKNKLIAHASSDGITSIEIDTNTDNNKDNNKDKLPNQSNKTIDSHNHHERSHNIDSHNINYNITLNLPNNMDIESLNLILNKLLDTKFKSNSSEKK